MSTSDLNPYATPADLAAPRDVVGDRKYFRDGDFLVVRDGAELPHVCVITNLPTEKEGWRKRITITWTPRWVLFTILLNIIVLLIAMLITQKKAKITYSVSAAARGKIVRRNMFGILLLLAALGLGVAAFQFSDRWEHAYFMLPMAGVALIVAAFYFVVANPVKSVRFHNGWFRVKGCSKDFLNTLGVFPYPF